MMSLVLWLPFFWLAVHGAQLWLKRTKPFLPLSQGRRPVVEVEVKHLAHCCDKRGCRGAHRAECIKKLDNSKIAKEQRFRRRLFGGANKLLSSEAKSRIQLLVAPHHLSVENQSYPSDEQKPARKGQNLYGSGFMSSEL